MPDPQPGFYAEQPREDIICQGDVFPRVLFMRPWQSGDIQILRSEGTPALVNSTQVPGAFERGMERVVVPGMLATGLVLSQTCDIAQERTIVVAAVYPLENMTKRERRASAVKRQTGHVFYLPPSGDFPASYADLSIIGTVLRGNLDLSSRVVSLSDWGRHHLAYQLHTFFGRPLLNWP
jgi:hypothetical protein